MRKQLDRGAGECRDESKKKKSRVEADALTMRFYFPLFVECIAL